MLKSKNIQYSDLPALPLNTAYFFNTSRYQFMISLSFTSSGSTLQTMNLNAIIIDRGLTRHPIY